MKEGCATLAGDAPEESFDRPAEEQPEPTDPPIDTLDSDVSESDDDGCSLQPGCRAIVLHHDTRPEICGVEVEVMGWPDVSASGPSAWPVRLVSGSGETLLLERRQLRRAAGLFSALGGSAPDVLALVLEPASLAEVMRVRSVDSSFRSIGSRVLRSDAWRRRAGRDAEIASALWAAQRYRAGRFPRPDTRRGEGPFAERTTAHADAVSSVCIGGIVAGDWSGVDGADSQQWRSPMGGGGAAADSCGGGPARIVVTSSWDGQTLLWQVGEADDAAGADADATAAGGALAWGEAGSGREAMAPARLLPMGHVPHPSAVLCTAMRGGSLATSCRDECVRVWARHLGSQLLWGSGPEGIGLSTSLAWADDLTLLSGGGGRDFKLRVWRSPAGGGDMRTVATGAGHRRLVAGLATLDGVAVSASWDTTLRTWDLPTAACVDCLEGHTEAVTGVAMRRGLIASGSRDGTAKLWDTRASSSRPVATLYEDNRSGGTIVTFHASLCQDGKARQGLHIADGVMTDNLERDNMEPENLKDDIDNARLADRGYFETKLLTAGQHGARCRRRRAATDCQRPSCFLVPRLHAFRT